MQAAFHSVHGWSISGSHAGARDRAAQGDVAHIFRYDGVRATGQRQFQTGRVRAYRQVGYFD